MLNKIKDIIKRKKNRKKNKCDKLAQENKQKDTNGHDVEPSNHDAEPSSNVIDLNKYRKQKKLMEKDIKIAKDNKHNINEVDKYDINDKKLINKFLEDERCYECNTKISNRARISHISDSGDYRYICCPCCGCIMKLDSELNLTSSKNILKEVSDAYTLFKKVNINPSSYSYTRNGDRHYF